MIKVKKCYVSYLENDRVNVKLLVSSKFNLKKQGLSNELNLVFEKFFYTDSSGEWLLECSLFSMFCLSLDESIIVSKILRQLNKYDKVKYKLIR